MGGSFALPKVLCECLVYLFAAFTETWREYNAEDDGDDDEDAGRVSPVNGVAENVADECCSNEQPQELQGDEFGLTEAVVAPEGTGIIAITLPHEHPQEGCNENKCYEGGDNAVPRGRYKTGDKGLAKVDHKRNNGHTEDTVDTNGNSYTLQVGLPATLLLTALVYFIVG